MGWIGLAAAVGAATIVAAPMLQDNPVKAGVEAWERGDYHAAVERWRGPAEKGDPDAQFNLGQAYKLGRGVQADLAQAERWYRKAALQGHPQAEDNYGLALFQNGKREAAVEWLKRSSARGEPRAQFVLGTMYFNGDGVEKDWVRAYALIVRSSQSGLSQASNTLSQMDKYMTLDDRQAGLALAKKYAEEANRAPLPPVRTARPATVEASPPAARPTMRPTPRPVAVATQPSSATPTARDGGWRVQLGAFADAGNAQRLWADVDSRFPGRQAWFVKSGRLTKLLVGPFASRAEAAAACGKVNPCIPVRK